MTEIHDVYACACPKGGKARSGDSFQVREFPEECLMLLTLADSVGSQLTDDVEGAYGYN